MNHQDRKLLEKAWKDFSDFTHMERTVDNFDLFSCGYVRGRADQLEISLARLQDLMPDFPGRKPKRRQCP